MKVKVSSQITYQCQENIPLILMLRPQSGIGQQVVEEKFQLTAGVAFTEYEDIYGNVCQRMLTPIGELTINASAVVETSPTIDVNSNSNAVSIEKLPENTLIYLLPSRYCESDKFLEMATEITQNFVTGYQKAEAIRQWIRQNITYEYGNSNASTSAVDINQTRIGVCRDFSHLGISLCRAISIPARMVVGYLHGLEPMDLHAWYEVYLENQWFTFDATQEFPKGNRVVLAYGRDASDVAFATQFGNLELVNMQVSVELA
jgi:transglutaminase-like putative cysteine protease